MSFKCKYCNGDFTSQAGVTRHVNEGRCPGYRLEVMKIEQQKQKEKEINSQKPVRITNLEPPKNPSPIYNINMYYNSNNTINSNTNNIVNIQTIQWKDNFNREYLLFEEKCKEILNMESSKNYLRNAPVKEIKKKLSEMLLYFKNEGVINETDYQLIKGNEVAIEVIGDENECMKYMYERPFVATSLITNEIKKLVNNKVAIEGDLFNDID